MVGASICTVIIIKLSLISSTSSVVLNILSFLKFIFLFSSPLFLTLS